MNATYIWVSSDGILNDKTYEFSEDSNIIEYPEWKINESNILVPILVYKDPFNEGDYILIFCDLYNNEGGSYVLDEMNKRKSFLNYIKYETNYEISQGYYINTPEPESDLFSLTDNLISVNYNIYNTFKDKCTEVGINVISNQDNYNIIDNKNIYENVWITRYILNKIAYLNNLTIEFSYLSLIKKDDNINTLFSNIKISPNVEDLLNDMKI